LGSAHPKHVDGLAGDVEATGNYEAIDVEIVTDDAARNNKDGVDVGEEDGHVARRNEHTRDLGGLVKQSSIS